MRAPCEAHGRHICPPCAPTATPFPPAERVVDAEAAVLDAAVALRHRPTREGFLALTERVDALEALFADLSETP